MSQENTYPHKLPSFKSGKNLLLLFGSIIPKSLTFPSEPAIKYPLGKTLRRKSSSFPIAMIFFATLSGTLQDTLWDSNHQYFIFFKNSSSKGHPDASGITESIPQYGHNAVRRRSRSSHQSTTSEAGYTRQQ